jgi:hypothetical protein
LAWTGPTGSPYLVELQRREGGGWSPVPGFPKRIAAFSLSVSGLELGEIFRWRVSTGNATSKWATVKLLRHEEKMQLAEARDRFGEDSFVYGSVCAQFGIYSEAKDALMHEAVAHPGEPGIINALVEVRRQISRLQ